MTIPRGEGIGTNPDKTNVDQDTTSKDVVPGTDYESAQQALIKLQEILGIEPDENGKFTPEQICQMRNYFAPDESWESQTTNVAVPRNFGKTPKEAITAWEENFYKHSGCHTIKLDPNVVIGYSDNRKLGVWDPKKLAQLKSERWRNEFFFEATSFINTDEWELSE